MNCKTDKCRQGLDACPTPDECGDDAMFDQVMGYILNALAGIGMLVVLVGVGIYYGWSMEKIAHPQEKPDAETCRTVDGWTAQIERTGGNGWACVMRSEDGKHVKSFFYGEKK